MSKYIKRAVVNGMAYEALEVPKTDGSVLSIGTITIPDHRGLSEERSISVGDSLVDPDALDLSVNTLNQGVESVRLDRERVLDLKRILEDWLDGATILQIAKSDTNHFKAGGGQE